MVDGFMKWILQCYVEIVAERVVSQFSKILQIKCNKKKNTKLDIAQNDSFFLKGATRSDDQQQRSDVYTFYGPNLSILP